VFSIPSAAGSLSGVQMDVGETVCAVRTVCCDATSADHSYSVGGEIFLFLTVLTKVVNKLFEGLL
jgi:hypothetical protein